MQEFINQFSNLSIDKGNDNNKIGLLYDYTTLLHKSTKNHPECPERIQKIIQNFKQTKIIPNKNVQEITQIQPIQNSLLELTHGENYTQFVLSMWPEQSKKSQIYINIDTYFMKDTVNAAKIASNAVIKSVDNIESNIWKSCFSIIRPPGHHSGMKAQPHGFCFFNNVAIGVNYAINKYKKQRILIIDWDAHHGQGTQKLFYSNQKVMYASIHRFDKGKFFPHIKQSSSQYIGQGKSMGYNINVAWNLKQKQKNKTFERFQTTGDQEYIYAFQRLLIPIFKKFNPELIFISAGFDSAQNDPLGQLRVTNIGYIYMTQKLKQINQKLIVVLQGGYNLESLKWASQSVLKTLLNQNQNEIIQKVKNMSQNYIPNMIGINAVDEAVKNLTKFWELDTKELQQLQLNKKRQSLQNFEEPKILIKNQLQVNIEVTGVTTRSKKRNLQNQQVKK